MTEATLSSWVEFGALLKSLRRQQGWTLQNLSKACGYSVSTISKIENAKREPNRKLVAELDRAMRKNGDLLRQWEKHRTRDSDPDWYRQVVTSEERATEIRMWHPWLIPGFMQTWDYARIIFRDGRPFDTSEQLNQLADLRVARLEALRQAQNPRMLAIISERTITDVVGSPQVMKDQLRHLLSLSEQVQTLVLPRSTPYHGGLSSGPFRILDFLDQDTQVYAEHSSGGELITEPDGVRRLVTIFGDLLTWALPPPASRERIQEVIGEMK